MGEDPHRYTINYPPLYLWGLFGLAYWIIPLQAIFEGVQNFKDIIRMGTGFSHIFDSTSPVRTVQFPC